MCAMGLCSAARRESERVQVFCDSGREQVQGLEEGSGGMPSLKR